MFQENQMWRIHNDFITQSPKDFINRRPIPEKGFESLKVINYSIPELREKIKEHKNLSVVFLFELEFHQPMSGEYKNFFVQIKRKHIYNSEEILRIVAEAEQECKDRIPDFETTGSGWVFVRAVNVDVRIQKYKP